MAKGKSWFVWQDGGTGLYRAELWWRPFSGEMIAFTRWVISKSQATRDGRSAFGADREDR